MRFLMMSTTKTIGNTAEQGAIYILHPVLSAENKETGKYYNQGIEEEPNKIVKDQEVAKKLWDVSEKILRDYGMI
jgi:hypothetical protein